MGWIENMFLERLEIGRQIEAFWNSVRDSVGRSAREYNTRVANMNGAVTFRRVDCDARAVRYCFRLEKLVAQETWVWIEMFLDQKERALKAAQAQGPIREICRYRLSADGLEFYTPSEEGPKPLSVEDACRLTLEEFMVKPFPSQFRDGQNFVVVDE